MVSTTPNDVLKNKTNSVQNHQPSAVMAELQ